MLSITSVKEPFEHGDYDRNCTLGRRLVQVGAGLLFWNSLGSARLHPMFALQFTAARAEWNRQCRRAQGLPAATSPAPRWKAVLKDWKWRLDDGLWHTSAGILKPGWMSLKSLQKVAIHSRLVGLWTKDTKTDGRRPNGKEPVFLFQANAALGMDYHSRRVLTGAVFTAKRSHGMVSSGAPLNVVCWFHLCMLLLCCLFPTWLQILLWLLLFSNSILFSDPPWVGTAVVS